MHMIVAIIQPHKLDAVRDALLMQNVEGMTLSEVSGYGRQGGRPKVYRGAEYEVKYTPKLKIEVAVASDKAAPIIDAIRSAAIDENIGSGKIFTVPIEQAVRIRTGEAGMDVL